jgi:hypothetical protein
MLVKRYLRPRWSESAPAQSVDFLARPVAPQSLKAMDLRGVMASFSDAVNDGNMATGSFRDRNK